MCGKKLRGFLSVFEINFYINIVLFFFIDTSVLELYALSKHSTLKQKVKSKKSV